MGVWPSSSSRGREIAGGVRALIPHLGIEVCACVLVCVSLGTTRLGTSHAVSSVLSPVSMSVQKFYMTAQCYWVLKKTAAPANAGQATTTRPTCNHSCRAGHTETGEIGRRPRVS